MNRRRTPGQTILLYSAVLLAAFWFLFPFYWLFMSSFMLPSEMGADPIHWIPEQPTLKNYADLLSGNTSRDPQYGKVSQGNRALRTLSNSVVVGFGVAISNLVLGSLAAYSFSRYRTRLNQVLLGAILGVRTIPAMALIVPFFLIFRRLGLVNNIWGLVLAHNVLILPFSIWVLKAYLDTVPRDIEEMSLIDGCNRMQSLWHILLPVARPGLVGAAVLAFMESWGEFFFSLILASDLTFPPMMAGLRVLVQINWNVLAAASVLGVLPPLVTVLVFQRFIVAGLGSGALK